MKARVWCLIFILPILVIFVLYGVSKGLSLVVEAEVDILEIEHENGEEILEGESMRLYAKTYPLNAASTINWETDDESIARIEMIDGIPYLIAIQTGIVQVTAKSETKRASVTFVVVTDDPTPRYILCFDPNQTEEGLDDTYYYGMYRFLGDDLIKDSIELVVKVYPQLFASQEVIFEVDSSVEVNGNKFSFTKTGTFPLRVRSREKEDVYTDFVFNVVEGVNVYSYEDLMKCTNSSLTGEVVVMQTNLESSSNYSKLSNPKKANTKIAGYQQGEKIVFDFLEIDTQYDVQYYHNIGKEVPKLKVGVNFKKDVYGNAFTINLHDLCFPSDLGSNRRPLLGKDDLFRGPLEFLNASGSIVYGQDNIGFLISESNLTVRNIKLKNCNNVTDLTYLDYVGTTLEIIDADNVSIIDSIISNGRTVIRSFSNENLLISGCLLEAAREFIFKIGSNSIIRSYTENGKFVLEPIPLDENGEILSDSNARIKDTFFSKSGIFCIGIDTHFSGPMLHKNDFFPNIRNLAATSYASHLTLEGDVRFYDWKKVSSLDSSTLISGLLGTAFNISKMIEIVSVGDNIIRNRNEEAYVHGGIAFFGGGKNYSTISFHKNELESEMKYLEISLNDERFDELTRKLALVAGEGKFRFYLYPSNYQKINIDSKVDIDALKAK